MPLVLGAPECDHADWAFKVSVGRCFGTMEDNADWMRILTVFVDQHEGPLAIWPEQGVGGYQYVALSIINIARSGKDLVFRVFRLRPLLRKHLRGVELRCSLLDLVVPVGHEHAVGSPAVFARGVRRRVWQGVVVVRSFAAGGEKACEGITQP
jgi:hypothetical protein